MIIGALGDIHGAFDTVHDIMQRHTDVPLWVCVGDVASNDGEYFTPTAPLYWIKGNNEDFDVVAAAAAGHLVTFGVTPTHAEAGYGYIDVGPPVDPGVAIPTMELQGVVEDVSLRRTQLRSLDGEVVNIHNSQIPAVRVLPSGMKEFDVDKWVNDGYVRKAFAELGLDYDKQLAGQANYEVQGEDAYCKKPIGDPRKAGEIWIEGEGILPFSSTACTLGAFAALRQLAAGQPPHHLVHGFLDAAEGVHQDKSTQHLRVAHRPLRCEPAPK